MTKTTFTFESNCFHPNTDIVERYMCRPQYVAYIQLLSLLAQQFYCFYILLLVFG